MPVVVVLLGTLIGLLLICRTPAALRVPAGDAGDGMYLAGMFPPEAGGLGDAFRWTTPLAQLRAPGTAFYPAMLLLRAHGDVEPSAPQRPVTVWRNELPIDVVQFGPGWRDYHLLVPGAAGGAAWDDPPLVLAIDPLPRTVDDGRDKGFPFGRFELLPIARTYIAWSVLPSIALLAVAAAALWRLDRMLGAPAAWRGGRIAALIGIFGLALLVWAARSPYALARNLPPLPWTIGLAGLLLLLVALPVRPYASRIRGAVSVLLILLGLAVLNSPAWLPLGGGLAAFGLLLFPWQGEPDITPVVEQRLSARVVGVGLVLVVGLALGLRLLRIDELPYGLWRDEGRHGLEALRMLRDAQYRPAYIETVDLPGLGLLPFSWALDVWGVRPWTLRTVTALAGALAVLPLYGLVSSLTGSRATALLAALLLAASHWSIALSRFSFPTMFDPLLQLSGLWLLLYALTGDRPPAQRWLTLLVSGACFGLAAQTYHTGRIGLLVAAAFVLNYWISNRDQRRIALPALVLLVVGFALTAFPLIEYAAQNTARFSSRLGAVSLLAEQTADWHSPLGKLDRSLGAHVMMWWARGDLNGRHVAPGRPMLDPITGLGLLIGLGLLVRGIADWRKRCLLLGLALGLLPSALAVEYPHAMRSVDALGFGCAIAALGLVAAGRTLARAVFGSSHERNAIGHRRLRHLGWAAACGMVILFNGWVYFAAMPSDRAVWTAVYPYHTQVGAYLRQLADQQGGTALSDVYVPGGLLDNEVYQFLAFGLEPQTYDPETPAQAAPGSRFVVLGTLAQTDVERIVQQQRLDPASGIAGPMLPDGSRPAFVVYQVTR